MLRNIVQLSRKRCKEEDEEGRRDKKQAATTSSDQLDKYKTNLVNVADHIVL